MTQYSESPNINPIKVRITAGGRFVVPASIREQLNVVEGDELLLYPESNGFRVTTFSAALGRAQALVSKHLKGKTSLAQELIAERRKEAKDG